MPREEPWRAQIEALGNFIRTQRHLANLSLRELAERTNVSNPYLSQIERGLHEPSVRVLRSIARALNLSAETLLSQAGVLELTPPLEFTRSGAQRQLPRYRWSTEQPPAGGSGAG